MILEYAVGGGINRDIPAHQLPEGVWSSGGNVRFKDGQVFKFAGHSSELSTTAVPYYLIPVPGTTTYWIIAGLTDVYAWDGTTEKEITRASGGDYSATADKNWTGGIIQGVPFLNNGVDSPQFWSRDFATPSKLAEITAWPSGYTCGTLRAFGEYMFALDVTKSGTRYPSLCLWSHAADPGSLPSTWDITDQTKLAGEFAIGATGNDGESEDTLLDCATMRNALYLYSAGKTFRATKAGYPAVFRFDQDVFTNIGCLGRRTVSNFDGGHFVVSSHDIVVHNGQEVTWSVDTKNRKHIFNNLDVNNYGRSFVVRHNFLHEMWFCYPEAGSSFPNKAMVWNWREDKIGFRDLPDVTHIMGGQVSSSTGTSWDSQTDSWDQQRRAWNSLGYSPTAPRLLMASQSGQALHVADNTNTFNGTNFTAFVRREALPLGVDAGGNKYVDLDNRYLIKTIYPKFTATGNIKVKLISQERPGGPVNEKMKTFDPTDYKVDLFHEGRLMGIEFSSNTAIDWQLQQFSLDVDRVGNY